MRDCTCLTRQGASPILRCAPAAARPVTPHRTFHHPMHRARAPIKVAAEGENGGSQQTEEAESRIAELERGRRRRNPPRPPSSPRQTSDVSSSGGGMAEWREGQLFPEGWEDMSPFKKASELWMGKRGAIFWANKLAWSSVFIVGGAWFLFRVVGPILGLYTLKNDLLSPPNL